jgi:hypothetical protein
MLFSHITTGPLLTSKRNRRIAGKDLASAGLKCHFTFTARSHVLPWKWVAPAGSFVNVPIEAQCQRLSVLYLSLVLSIILLVLAVFAARALARPGGINWLEAFLFCGIMFCLLPNLANFWLPPVVFQFLALTVLIAILRKLSLRGSRLLALGLALAVTVAVYGVATLVAVYAFAEINRLAELYPEESLEERIAVLEPGMRPKRLSADADEQLGRLERELDIQEVRFGFRNRSLRTLHNDTVRKFVNSPGFGVTRLKRPSMNDLTRGVRDTASVPQPVPRSVPTESLAMTEPRPLAAAERGLTSLHVSAVTDFVNHPGYGYVKDLRHVSGHLPHAFSKVPEQAEQWNVETLDLVSLIRHAGPVAYVSADLPRMDELSDAPTRPLDTFESASLARLRDGESLVVGSDGPHLRMFGALHSARECTTCHGGERGDVLGAFSYVLRRDVR